ncbi:MAG: TrkH family potassium uptake protein [Proteobacteria bacterium]|nr:TrkH family potassium uptake protein [Pseudomonadota bacterium]
MKKILEKSYDTLTTLVQRRLFKTPARLSMVTFLLLISIGTFLLCLPVSSKTGSLTLINALFTSTSASCVTGLSVININESLSVFGQCVLLCLIQVGGLGIMTISTVLILVAGGKASFAEINLVHDTYTHSDSRSAGSILREIFLLTFFLETLGALLLFTRFYPVYGASRGAYVAVFHSVSAFCNAGFSLFPDSLEGFRNDFIVNLVISVLILTGGIGFLVIAELRNNFPVNKRTWKRLSLHTKLILVSSLVLVFGGTLVILIMEWDNTLAGMDPAHKVLASFFQSVTLRTAGFNTIPISTMANQTLFISIIFMFIGASPGSCGGGVKTSTMATLFLLGLSRLRGQSCTAAFNRTIPEQSVTKATNMIMISLFVVIIGTILLLMTEVGRIPHAESRGKFIEILYETVSAFGTVGLSMGLTETLTSAGRLIITLIMFTGRLGPMIIAVAISRKELKHFTYAHEDIMVG